jgi:hypothetical protein
MVGAPLVFCGLGRLRELVLWQVLTACIGTDLYPERFFFWLCVCIYFFGSQADIDAEVGTVQPKKRTFKKFTFRGVDLDALLDMSSDELVELFHARARRRYAPSLRLQELSCPHQMNSDFAICVESLTVGVGAIVQIFLCPLKRATE